MTAPRLLLVGAGVQGAEYIPAAQRLGVEVLLLDTRERIATDPPAASTRLGVRGDTDGAWYGAACRLLAGRPPDAVVAFAEPHVIAAAMVADQFALPGPGLRAAVVSRDKSLQRVTLGAAGLAQPDWHLVTDVGEACDWAGRHGPVVCKPARGSGSRGVVLVDRPGDLGAVLDTAMARGPVLLESLCGDPEYSVEALLHRREVVFMNVTEKTTTAPPHFVELGHLAGIELDERGRDLVHGMVGRIVGALGMSDGILHLEFRLGREATIMEFAVRTPGDFIMDIINLTYGIDMYALVVEVALGRRPSVPSVWPPKRRYARSGFLTGVPGRVVSIQGLDAAREMDGVHLCDVDVAEGGEVRSLCSSSDRVGSVVVSGAARSEVDRRLAQVIEAVSVTTVPCR
jgi:biotin carboxylase